jgi:osmotically-inducible protein OsmY
MVLDELEFEPKIDAADIGVAVEKGVVTLTGHVANYAQKFATQQAVQRLRGVRAVADEIEVRFSGSPETADDQIAKRALDILKWSEMVPDENIKVMVRNGYVTLTGTVDWHFQRVAAEDAIRKLSYITGVGNRIEIRIRASVADVKKKIEEALKRNAETEARRITVSVTDGTVRLEGRVDNWSERQAVENAAWSVSGVLRVDDRLTLP